MAGSAGTGDQPRNVLNIGERVHVTAAARKPPVESIGERRSIGDCNVEASAGRKDADDFVDGALQIFKMLQAMVTDYGLEGMVAKGEVRGIAAGEIPGWVKRRITSSGEVEVRADDGLGGGGLEAAGAASQVKNQRSGWQLRENFVHASNSIKNCRDKNGNRNYPVARVRHWESRDLPQEFALLRAAPLTDGSNPGDPYEHELQVVQAYGTRLAHHKGMLKNGKSKHEFHREAAAMHENAAKAHRTAAENNQKGDEASGSWHADRAMEYSDHAYELAKEAHSKSGQIESL